MAGNLTRRWGRAGEGQDGGRFARARRGEGGRPLPWMGPGGRDLRQPPPSGIRPQPRTCVR